MCRLIDTDWSEKHVFHSKLMRDNYIKVVRWFAIGETNLQVCEIRVLVAPMFPHPLFPCVFTVDVLSSL